ncbi:DNA-3-methyladenine glycosylase family protein [Halocalculus aciditolerans]|uniref:3-methyladenine DNA glycosylase n=1 Tax=Halocalculus aciditolerans TaxID=1383812 RepID=A0A830F1U7_9EURY|nr:DNA-3-methyladenine glycosylase 2 family protein [Halocalculus aciditolerans]GGL53620.1 3-methyladenine DNA glycosylase [Halocalculus aciditolerans]
MTDTDDDARDARAVLTRDPAMADLVAEHGPLTLEPADDPFERLVVAVVNQQLSTQSAAAIRDRLFDAVDVTPDGIRNADDDTLRDCGLSAQKIRYVRNIADHFPDGIDTATYADATDDDVRADLTQITGVGDWTADMFLIFCLGRPDVFPVGDLGIRNAMTAVYGIEDRAAMVEKAEEWSPYRSHAARYLWRAVD